MVSIETGTISADDTTIAVEAASEAVEQEVAQQSNEEILHLLSRVVTASESFKNGGTCQDTFRQAAEDICNAVKIAVAMQSEPKPPLMQYHDAEENWRRNVLPPQNTTNLPC